MGLGTETMTRIDRGDEDGIVIPGPYSARCHPELDGQIGCIKVIYGPIDGDDNWAIHLIQQRLQRIELSPSHVGCPCAAHLTNLKDGNKREVLAKSRRPISDFETRQKKNQCYADIESGLWGWQCKSSLIAKENCALRCLSSTCYELVYESDPLEEGEKDLVRGQEFKYCMHNVGGAHQGQSPVVCGQVIPAATFRIY
ncbi:unnamed protein product [Prunus armeniaca]|uniref:Uncharacterized protein n=1 Tax=Prunus armeniaca TaxID=36596 RepID=A0A6J5TZ97_PRUAR|nr:unnamed protein product [Prunus armeniaca]